MYGSKHYRVDDPRSSVSVRQMVGNLSATVCGQMVIKVGQQKVVKILLKFVQCF
jgi:hypothetical protein